MNSLLDNIHIIMVGTTHPGNIGAAARAMKTMGLSQLVLVEPKKFPAMEATARASGASDILKYARVFDSFAESIQDYHVLYGASARQRGIPWPVVSPRECAAQIFTGATDRRIGIIFGREHSGLTNEELEKCHALLQIPTYSDFSSLNVAAAIQVVAYELLISAKQQEAENSTGLPIPTPEEIIKPVSQHEMDLFYAHLEQTLIELEFFNPEKPKLLMRRLQRMFNRLQPDQSEVNILRGILTAAQQKRKLLK